MSDSSLKICRFTVVDLECTILDLIIILTCLYSKMRLLLLTVTETLEIFKMLAHCIPLKNVGMLFRCIFPSKYTWEIAPYIYSKWCTYPWLNGITCLYICGDSVYLWWPWLYLRKRKRHISFNLPQLNSVSNSVAYTLSFRHKTLLQWLTLTK